MRWLVTLVGFGLASPAIAAPTYLECNFPEKPEHPINVTADEAAGTATVYVPSTGHTERFQATFLPEKLIFLGKLLDYEISRTDLSIRRTIRMINSSDIGTCKVTTAPDRAF